MGYRADLVEETQLPVVFYGSYLVGHHITSDTGSGGIENVMYARQGTALGKGQFGQIHLEHAQNECSNAAGVRAVKEISKSFCSELKIEWKREVEALALLSKSEQHELFIEFYGWYENETTVFMAMEYFPLGDLSRYVKEIVRETEIQEITRQITAGLCAMHEHSIVHRDLNPRNIFVAARKPTWQIKLADFGSSKHLNDSTGLWTTTGTAGYMAPEYQDFMRDNSEYAQPTSAVDLWSLGCVIYELFTKERFFQEQYKALRTYCRDPVLPLAVKNSFASPSALDALEKFLDPSVDGRITAEEAMSLLWLAGDASEATRTPPTFSYEHVGSDYTIPQESDTISPMMSTLTLHPADSCISLASTATLVSGQEDVVHPLRKLDTGSSVMSMNSSFSEPLPPRMPPRRQSSGNSTSTLPPRMPPRRPSNTPRSPSLSVTPTFERSTTPTLPKQQTGHPNLYQGGAFDSTPSLNNTLPPLSRTLSPEESGQVALIPTQEQKDTIELDAVPWLQCFYEHQELFMNFGTLVAEQDNSACCDLCEERMRTSGMQRQNGPQNFLHLCESCGRNRVLCERCAREAINRPTDPHEAEHLLRRVGPAFSVHFPRFFERQPIDVMSSESLPPHFGENWLATDHGFQAPSFIPCQYLRSRFAIAVPAGIHQVAAYLHVSFDPNQVTSESLGAYQKKMMKFSKSAYGYISVGVDVVDANSNGPSPQNRYMPTNHAEKEILYTSGTYDINLQIPLPAPAAVQPGQRLELTIRSSHDPVVFKKGCPFKWHLNYVGTSQFGTKIQLASKGQLLRRQHFVEQQQQHQKQVARDKKIEYSMTALKMGTMAVGLGGAVSGFQAHRAKKRHHQWGQYGAMVHAANGLQGGSGASHAGSYNDLGHQQHGGGWETSSAVGSEYGGGGSDMTQQWVNSQSTAIDQPFVASYESVEYTVGGSGATATYSYVGALI